MKGANRHLGDLSDGVVSDLSDITRQFFICRLECLLPEPGQPDSATVGVNIPHVPHHLLPLLHFENVEVVVDGSVDVVGEGIERAGPAERDGAGEHGPKREKQDRR